MKRASEVAAVLLAVVSFALALATSARTSATWDEPFYLGQGLAYWEKHEYWVSRTAAPLPAALGSLAALTLRPEVPFDDPTWKERNGWGFASVLVNRANRPIATRLISRARIPIALLSSLVVLVVFAWGRRLQGDAAGLAAAGLAAFSPSWLAHASLFTTDALVSVFMAAVILAVAELPGLPVGNLGWKRAAAIGGLVFLALASKMTALLLGPLIPLVVATIWLQRRRARQESAGPGALFKVLLRAAAVAVVLVSALLYPGELGLVGYIQGFRHLYSDLDASTARFFFWGSYSDHGFPLYGAGCVLLKSTVGELALASVGAFLALRRARTKPELLAPLLLAVAAVAISALDRAAFGLRRVLPAYPGLFVLGGIAVGAAWEEARRTWRGRAALAVALALVVAHAASSLRAFPAYLPYLNEVAGGAERAPDYFSDSNLDWGQAVPELARELEARKPKEARFLYYGRMDPALYGVDAALVTSFEELANPKPGVLYAISATRLVQARGLVREGKLAPEADWLRRFRPIARPGEAIYLYELGERP